jgi:hypothetical protein
LGVKVTKGRLNDVLAAIKSLTSKEVLVGIPKESAERPRDPDDDEEPITNSELGYIHEFGVPERNIPARPFLIPGVEKILPDAIARFKKAGVKALDGDLSQVDQQMTAVGLIAAAAVQQKIVDGPFAPLAPLTIAKRVARGVTRTDPLRDTGAMRQAVTYVIAKKEP